MSTASQSPEQAPQQLAPTDAGSAGKVYRGRSVAELIPRIQADLGPEAIVLRRRSGLEGGIGGFFQRAFVEIEAREGGARVDIYDGADETPKPEGFPALQLDSAPQPLERVLQPSNDLHQPDPSAFANALAAAGISVSDIRPPEVKATAPAVPAKAPAPSHMLSAYTSAPTVDIPAPAPAFEPVAAPTPGASTTLAPVPQQAVALPAVAQPAVAQPAMAPEPVATSQLAASPKTLQAPRTKTQLAIAKELIETGMAERFAYELIEAASAHVLAFNPRMGLRKAVRIELQRRIPTASPLPGRGGAIALVGPGGSGKTRCVAALAGIYRRAETLKAACASVLAGEHEGGLKMILSPAITTPTDAGSVKALRALTAARTQGIALIDTPPVSPADQGSINALAKLLAAAAPDRIAIALPATLGAKATTQLLEALKPLKADALAITHADETDQIGVAVQAACESGLAPEYLVAGGRGERSLSRLDPATLAERLLR